MKHKIYLLVAMLTMALALTSCFKDEEETKNYNSHATAIIAFSLKEIKAPRDTTNKAGKDTTIIAKYKPAAYKFYINQNN